MTLVSVLVDSREPEHIRKLTFGGVPVVVTMLDAGDLLCATDDNGLLAVERKEVNDLLNSLRDDRLFGQLARLREVSPWAYLAICGQLQPGPGGKCFVNGVESGWSWASIQGALLTAQEIGVHVLHVASDYDFEAAVIRLAGRNRGVHRVEPARQTVAMSDGEVVLAALPGVGPERAKALMDHLGTAYVALNYLTTWQKYWEPPRSLGVRVPGVGDGVRRQVRNALGLDKELYLMAGVFASRNGDDGNERNTSDSNSAGDNAVALADDSGDRGTDAPVEAIRG